MWPRPVWVRHLQLSARRCLPRSPKARLAVLFSVAPNRLCFAGLFCPGSERRSCVAGSVFMNQESVRLRLKTKVLFSVKWKGCSQAAGVLFWWERKPLNVAKELQGSGVDTRLVPPPGQEDPYCKYTKHPAHRDPENTGECQEKHNGRVPLRLSHGRRSLLHTRISTRPNVYLCLGPSLSLSVDV